MSLANHPFALTFVSGGPRDGHGYTWDDGVPGPVPRFDSNPDRQVIDAAAASVARLEPNPDTTLIDGRLELYPLDADDRAGDDAEPVATAELGGDADGLNVPLPVDHGRWLLSLYVHWQTDCAGGDGFVDLLLIT